MFGEYFLRFVQILSNLSRLKAHKVYLVILLVCIAVSLQRLADVQNKFFQCTFPCMTLTLKLNFLICF